MTQACGRRNSLVHASRSGFTLIEVMLVVVIIGVLSAIAVVAIKGRSAQAYGTATRATIAGTATALDLFEVDNGTYPNSLNELVNDTGHSTWQGPYIKSGRLPQDAWGRELNYSKSDKGYKIVSAAADGQFGSADDLTN